MTKISATPIADDPRSPTPRPRGNPRQAVLDRLDDFEKHIDLLINHPAFDSSAGRSNPQQQSLAPVRLPLSDIFFTVSATAYVCITTILSIAYLVR